MRRRRSGDEPLGMGRIGGVEPDLARGHDLLHEAAVDGARREHRDATVMVLVVVPGEEQAKERSPSSSEAKLPGKNGQYFNVLNCASEQGLSFEVRGRLCDLTTPRSSRRVA